MANLPTPGQGAPFYWVVPCDNQGNYAPPGEPTEVQVDQSGQNTAGAIVLTLPAGAAGVFTYLDGILITGAPGTVIGNSELSIGGLNSPFVTEIVNPIAGGEIYTVIFTIPRKSSAPATSISVTLAAMQATSGKIAMTILGHQK